jgi:ankyrin repeat protein
MHRLALSLLVSLLASTFSFAKGPQPELYLAAQRGDTAAIKTLLAEGAPVDVTNVENATPLMAACAAGQPDAAKLLLEKGAKVNFQSKTAPYHTPLFCAVLGRHHELARLLLARGAKRELRDSVEKTVLDRARELGDAKMIGILESKSAP